jgi:CRP/FNR family transcriptional regulator, cyclic AMP receptor protein
VNTAAELIRRIDFFQPLDDRTVNQIARVCIVREYSPGDYIVRQGDAGLGLYFITRGHARVEMVRDGASTLIAELNPGEFVGELSIIDKKPRLANVICTTDTSCLLLTRDRFTKLLHKYPEIAMQMARALAARLRTTDEWLLEGAATAVPKPVIVPPAPIPQARPQDDRQRIKNLLADTVGWFYLLKSITQVSLAIVGCPVTVSLETKSSESDITTIGPLKLVIFPAHENHIIGVHAFDDGAFRATVLTPASISRLTAPIKRNESAWLHIPPEQFHKYRATSPEFPCKPRRICSTGDLVAGGLVAAPLPCGAGCQPARGCQPRWPVARELHDLLRTLNRLTDARDVPQ